MQFYRKLRISLDNPDSPIIKYTKISVPEMILISDLCLFLKIQMSSEILRCVGMPRNVTKRPFLVSSLGSFFSIEAAAASAVYGGQKLLVSFFPHFHMSQKVE